MQEIEAENTQYWYYPDDELDKILATFWFAVKTQRPALEEQAKEEAIRKGNDPHPERYTIASLRNLRNGLSRCLASHGKNIDLTTDEKFRHSQNAFKDACKELKQLGKGIVVCYPEITHGGTFPLSVPLENFQKFHFLKFIAAVQFFAHK